MVSGEISLDNHHANRAYAGSELGRLALITICVGLLTASSILMLIYQENRAVQYSIEASEVWSAYQVKNLKAAIEEDPNLKAQYAEEQDALRLDAQALRDKSSDAKDAVMISAYSALLLLFGAGTAVFALVAKSIHKFKVAAIGAPLLIMVFAIYSLAPDKSSTPTSPSKNFANVSIKNFGQMDDHFYRGAQPKEREYKQLAELGVRAIIDLRDDPLPYANKAAEAARMRYFNIPMSDKSYPDDESIEKFLGLAREEGNWPFYVHCAGGRHRSGVIGAMYRFNHDEWNYDRAYEEMKNYDFYTRFGHGALKTYVEAYWQKFQTKRSNPSSVPVPE